MSVQHRCPDTAPAKTGTYFDDPPAVTKNPKSNTAIPSPLFSSALPYRPNTLFGGYGRPTRA